MRATGHAEAADLTAEHERAAHVAGDARVPCRPGCGRLLGRELVHEAAERKAVAKPQAIDVEAERHGAEAGLSAVAVDALLDAVERRQRTAHTLDLPYPVEISHDQVVARQDVGQTRSPTSAPPRAMSGAWHRTWPDSRGLTTARAALVGTLDERLIFAASRLDRASEEREYRGHVEIPGRRREADDRPEAAPPPVVRTSD